MITGIEGVDNISHDIIVHGFVQEMHNHQLHARFQHLSDRRIILNKANCQFNMGKLVFMGMLLSGPSEARVQALVEARMPQNVHELHGFLRLANYSA